MKPASQIVQGSSIRQGPHLEHIWTSLGLWPAEEACMKQPWPREHRRARGRKWRRQRFDTWVGDCPEASWPDKGWTLQTPSWNQRGHAQSTSNILGQSHNQRGTQSNGDRAGPRCDVVEGKRGMVLIWLTRKNIQRGTRTSDSKPHPQPPAIWHQCVFLLRNSTASSS